MKSADKIKQIAFNAISTEEKAVKGLKKSINDVFVSVVKLILITKGRVVITGIGKSAIIAQKIVATLNSTGTPSVFMHAADAVHGDLGTITDDDVVICISKSGNTPEIKVLVPLLKAGGCKLVGMTGNKDSFLAANSDHVLNCKVEKEACPHDLAPTSSTTVQLVLGDALAICLLECRDFSSKDFAKYHPGGSLGKRLYLKAGDLSKQNERPVVGPEDPVKKVIHEISSKRIGAAAVVHKGKLAGVITDGDIRRMLEKHNDISKLIASDIMSKKPKTIEAEELAMEAMKRMRSFNISQIVVVKDGNFSGFVHFHDLLKEGMI